MLRRQARPLDKIRLSASSNCAPHRISWKTKRRVVFGSSSILGFWLRFQSVLNKNPRKNSPQRHRDTEKTMLTFFEIFSFFSVSLCLCASVVNSFSQTKRPPKFPPMALKAIVYNFLNQELVAE